MTPRKVRWYRERFGTGALELIQMWENAHGKVSVAEALRQRTTGYYYFVLHLLIVFLLSFFWSGILSSNEPEALRWFCILGGMYSVIVLCVFHKMISVAHFLLEVQNPDIRFLADADKLKILLGHIPDGHVEIVDFMVRTIECNCSRVLECEAFAYHLKDDLDSMTSYLKRRGAYKDGISEQTSFFQKFGVRIILHECYDKAHESLPDNWKEWLRDKFHKQTPDESQTKETATPSGEPASISFERLIDVGCSAQLPWPTTI